jgi:CheY-like chemotaxis protein/HPt (histidine-containing phosphotransfer) domain-containing protein
MDQVKVMLAALRSNYLRDLPSHIDELEELLLGLERDGFDLETCRDLYRRVHSLKGSGGTYGVHVLSDVCHPFEDLLSSLLERPELLRIGFTETALKYIDLMRQVHTFYATDNEPGAEIKQILLELRQNATTTSHSALIVEGSDVVIGMLKEVLKSRGYRIEVVSDGYEALGRLLAEHFDVLVTGLETKRLNGLALISAVQKSGPRTSKTKTILLTATQLKSNSDNPDFIIKKDANLKEKFKEIVNALVIS